MAIRSCIIGTGHYLPEKIMTNHDLEKIVDTTDEWIVQRSGISERHIANDAETTSFMATKAALKALEAAKITPADIDAIIVATTTPDNTFPSVAAKVQADIGAPIGVAFDVQAVCTGFVYALSVADNFIKNGQFKRALVIGAEKMSAILNWEDRTTCVLFGDGAGAVVVEARDSLDGQEEGILSTHLYANGTMRDLLYTNGGVSTTGHAGTILMEGREIFKNAVNLMASAVESALQANNLSADQIDWLVPHQANIRIIESTAKKLDMPMEKVVTTVAYHGNTSAASIPMALDVAVRDGRIKAGQYVLMEALGGGLTWGSALVRMS